METHVVVESKTKKIANSQLLRSSSLYMTGPAKRLAAALPVFVRPTKLPISICRSFTDRIPMLLWIVGPSMRSIRQNEKNHKVRINH